MLEAIAKQKIILASASKRMPIDKLQQIDENVDGEQVVSEQSADISSVSVSDDSSGGGVEAEQNSVNSRSTMPSKNLVGQSDSMTGGIEEEEKHN